MADNKVSMDIQRVLSKLSLNFTIIMLIVITLH